MPGPGISQLASWPPDLEESRLDGARKPRPTKFTYYIQLAVRTLCRIFIELHFAGEFMKNLKQLCGFGCIFRKQDG